jgi:hypothetical protein
LRLPQIFLPIKTKKPKEMNSLLRKTTAKTAALTQDNFSSSSDLAFSNNCSLSPSPHRNPIYSQSLRSPITGPGKSHKISPAQGDLDRKIFLHNHFANFSEQNFGSGFAGTFEIHKTQQVTSKNFLETRKIQFATVQTT